MCLSRVPESFLNEKTGHRWCPSGRQGGASTAAGFGQPGPSAPRHLAGNWQIPLPKSLDFHLSPNSLKTDVDQLMCLVKMQECPDKVTDMFRGRAHALNSGFHILGSMCIGLNCTPFWKDFEGYC